MRYVIVALLLLVFVLAPAGAQSGITLEGVIEVGHFDPGPGSGLPYYNQVYLYATDGSTYILDVPAVHVTSHVGEYITVTGTQVIQPAAQGDTPVIAVDTIRWGEGIQGIPRDGWTWALNPTAGNFKFINVLCRFSDSSGTPPAPAYFNGLIGAEYPGINHYYQTISYNKVNLDGSTTTSQWYTLPQPIAYYADIVANNNNWQEIIGQACGELAQGEIDFASYQGINFIFDGEFSQYAWGLTGGQFTLNGQTARWKATLNPPFSWQHQGLFAHEIGHTLSLPHSSGIRGDAGESWPYDSMWDVMSGNGNYTFDNDPGNDSKIVLSPNGTYGRISPATNAFYSSGLSWVDAARIVSVGKGKSQTVQLERLLSPQSNNPQLIIVPIQDSASRFYVVELRQHVSYDAAVPNEGVVIYIVDYDLHLNNQNGNDAPARVVDGDTGNTNVNDDGSTWVVGEIFTDTVNNISIKIDQNNGSNFTVTVKNDALNVATINRLRPAANATIATASDYAQQFQWEPVAGAEYYHVVIATEDLKTFLFAQWYAASEVCNTTVCTMKDSVWLPQSGNFVWWMGYYNAAVGAAYLQTYQESKFTVQMNKPATVTFTTPPAGQSELQWAENPDAIFYRIWAGTSDYQSTLVFDWFLYSNICTGSVCKLPGTFNIEAGKTYEVFMEFWGPGGYTTWTKVANFSG